MTGYSSPARSGYRRGGPAGHTGGGRRSMCRASASSCSLTCWGGPSAWWAAMNKSRRCGHPAVVGEETVSLCVKLLRLALGDADAPRLRYLRSVRGRATELNDLPRVRWRDFGRERASPPSPPAPRAQRAVSRSPSRSRWWWAAGLASRHGRESAAPPLLGAPAITPASVRPTTTIVPSHWTNKRWRRRCRIRAPCWRGLAWGAQRPHLPVQRRRLRSAARRCARAPALLRTAREDAVAWAALGYAQDWLSDMGAAVAGYENRDTPGPGRRLSRASLAYSTRSS